MFVKLTAEVQKAQRKSLNDVMHPGCDLRAEDLEGCHIHIPEDPVLADPPSTGPLL
jgi:hypothetical protein